MEAHDNEQPSQREKGNDEKKALENGADSNPSTSAEGVVDPRGQRRKLVNDDKDDDSDDNDACTHTESIMRVISDHYDRDVQSHSVRNGEPRNVNGRKGATQNDIDRKIELKTKLQNVNEESPRAEPSNQNDLGNSVLTNDSFQTVEPPVLRHAGCDVSSDVEEEFPGARAVYPNNPLRNAGYINNLTISKTPDDIGDDSNNRTSSLSLLRSDEPSLLGSENRPNTDSNTISDSDSKLIASVKVEPVVMARLVRESEILDHQKYQPADQPRPSDIAEAIEVKGDVNEEEVTRRTLISAMKDWRVVLGLLILLALAMGVTVGIIKLTEGKDDTDGDAQDIKPDFNQTIFLTPGQIADNELIFQTLLPLLPPPSVIAISTPGSSHSTAIDWLVEHNNLEELPLFRIIQRYALAVLYFSTGGVNSWKNKTFWLSRLNECEWFQTDRYNGRKVVPCDEGTSILKTLVLVENRVLGSIPIDVKLLSNLELVALPSNFLQGDIVSGPTRMVNLASLDLGSNNLQGSLPPLTNHSKLVALNFSSNNFDGSIPESYSNLTSLEMLDLSHNPGINGTIPEMLSQLTRLRQLSIDGTEVTGTVPDAFCHDGRVINISIDCDQIRCVCCRC